MKNLKVNTKKTFGLGTLSLIICIITMILTYTYPDKQSLGQELLSKIGFSNVPILLISLILFIISSFLGNKFIHNFGGVWGKYLSIFNIILVLILAALIGSFY